MENNMRADMLMGQQHTKSCNAFNCLNIKCNMTNLYNIYCIYIFSITRFLSHLYLKTALHPS